MQRGPNSDEVADDRLEAFEEALRKSIFPFPVEARDCQRLSEQFPREIERKQLVFVELPCALEELDRAGLAIAS